MPLLLEELSDPQVGGSEPREEGSVVRAESSSGSQRGKKMCVERSRRSVGSQEAPREGNWWTAKHVWTCGTSDHLPAHSNNFQHSGGLKSHMSR